MNSPALGGVYGVVVPFHLRPPPPISNAPTITCPGDLSCSLPLLIGFDAVEVDHSGRVGAAKGARLDRLQASS
jgi:hypothetical protein